MAKEKKILTPLEDAENKIKMGWVAAIISGVLTLGVTLYAMSGGELLGFDAWSLIDVALIFGLAFGIWRKSRVCAVLMLVYFVASKIFIIVEQRQANGLLMAIVFAYFFTMGVIGTFKFHKLKRDAATAAEGS